MTAGSPADVLALEIAGYKALLRLLDGECDALRRLDVEGIENAAAAKQAQVQALEQLARLREDQLRASGLPCSAEGVALWLAGSGASDAGSAWTTLLDLARAARNANARNGRLIAASVATTTARWRRCCRRPVCRRCTARTDVRSMRPAGARSPPSELV